MPWWCGSFRCEKWTSWNSRWDRPGVGQGPKHSSRHVWLRGTFDLFSFWNKTWLKRQKKCFINYHWLLNCVGFTLSRMRRWSWRRPPWLVSWWPVPRRDKGSPARPCSREPGAWGRKPSWVGSRSGHQQNSNLFVFSQLSVALNHAMLSMVLCSCRRSKSFLRVRDWKE